MTSPIDLASLAHNLNHEPVPDIWTAEDEAARCSPAMAVAVFFIGGALVWGVIIAIGFAIAALVLP